MGTRVVAHSVGTASTSDLAGVLGCSGCTRVPNPGPIPLVLGFSLPEFVGNRRRVGVSVAVSVLVTLLVRFGGVELGSGLRVLQAELSVVAALMLPDDFDVAVMRVWLGLKRSLTEC